VRLLSAGNGLWDARAEKALSKILRTTGTSWQPESGYLTAISRLLFHVERNGRQLSILKTDLWNEGIDTRRDVLSALSSNSRFCLLAVDISKITCTRAKRRLSKTTILNADIRDLPFRNETIDIILDLSTIDHVSPIQVPRVIHEYYRSLRNGSLLLLIFWFDGPLLKLFRKLKPPYEFDIPPYRYYFPVHHMKGLVRAEGFDLLDEYSAVGFGKDSLSRVGQTSNRMAQFVYSVVLRLEYSAASKVLLRPFGGLYVIIARKTKPSSL